ncbi:hypothetical protein HHK36_029063 [Tetracentron sinense]|uniref:Programmed cell death protein 7 n=1 Tax=Tetracentron sinense TaxID=13715 RepID=A0A834YGY3_TETSI|nr:hypothetical protein HHK36_029063 [Tetracentron sinense]
MNPMPFTSGAPPPWFPILQAVPPMSSSFWEATNVHDRLRDFQDTIDLAKAVQKELEMMILMKETIGSGEDVDKASLDASVNRLSKLIKEKRINLKSQESLSMEAANSLISTLKGQLEPFNVLTSQTNSWEEKSAAFKLANKIQKSKRNKRWRKKKRKCIAEMLSKERERFDQADQEADEWRTREIAKDIAKRKMEKMKEIAKLKANEERQRLESEGVCIMRFPDVGLVHSYGHFLPEEDDKFLERVRAAVEEEERQAIATAGPDAAKDAIATAEESRKTTQRRILDSEDVISNHGTEKVTQDQLTQSEDKRDSSTAADLISDKRGSEGQGNGGAYDSVASLPIEFYHYYHGSNTDLGTLIEVRRTWDAYIRPGGSRIPAHWVQPPAPVNEVWASYLVLTDRCSSFLDFGDLLGFPLYLPGLLIEGGRSIGSSSQGIQFGPLEGAKS